MLGFFISRVLERSKKITFEDGFLMSGWAVSWSVLWIAFSSIFRNKWDISGQRMGDGETTVQGTGQQIQGM